MRLFRILCAKIINAHLGVVNEMRAHLQHHNIGALVCNFLVHFKILFNLIVQYNKRMNNYDDCIGNLINQEGDIIFLG